VKRTRPAVTAVDVAVDCLAVARMTKLVQEDEFPFGPAREWVLDVFAEAKPAELLRCPYCASMWLGMLAVYARHRWPRAWPLASRVLASSLVAGLVAEWSDRS